MPETKWQPLEIKLQVKVTNLKNFIRIAKFSSSTFQIFMQSDSHTQRH